MSRENTEATTPHLTEETASTEPDSMSRENGLSDTDLHHQPRLQRSPTR